MPAYNPYMLQIVRLVDADETLELLGYAIAVVGTCLLGEQPCSGRESIERALREPDSLAENDAVLRSHLEALRAVAERVKKQFFWAKLHSLLLNDMRRLGLVETYRGDSDSPSYVSPDESGWPQRSLAKPGPALIAARKVLERCLASSGDATTCLRLAGALALLLFFWLDGGSRAMHRVFLELADGGDGALERLATELSNNLGMDREHARKMLQGMRETLRRAIEVVEDAGRGPLRGIVPAYYLPLRERPRKGGTP